MKSKTVIALFLFAMALTALIASGSTATNGRLDKLANSELSSLSDPSHINGTVTDAVTASPIKDANVTAGGVFDLTDDNGHYDLEVVSGIYTVTATKSGYVSQSKNAVVAINQTVTVNFALSLLPAQMGWIAGNVTDAGASMSIEGVNVTVNGFSTETNATGRYRIQVPAPGNYAVTATKSGYVSQSKNADVVVNQTTTVDFALSPVAEQIKAFVVVNPRALNLRSQGRWITVSIELPKNVNAQDIDVSSTELSIQSNNTVPVDPTAPMEINNSTLTIKFSREAVEALILQELAQNSRFGTATLGISGKLKNGTTFTGNDTIKVIFEMPLARS